jgi:hypothetical protein
LEQTDHRILIVEVKCFPPSRSIVDEFYHAIGQVIVYQTALDLADIPFTLYLAVPLHVFDEVLNQGDVLREALLHVKIKAVVVVDLVNEELVTWLD